MIEVHYGVRHSASMFGCGTLGFSGYAGVAQTLDELFFGQLGDVFGQAQGIAGIFVIAINVDALSGLPVLLLLLPPNPEGGRSWSAAVHFVFTGFCTDGFHRISAIQVVHVFWFSASLFSFLLLWTIHELAKLVLVPSYVLHGLLLLLLLVTRCGENPLVPVLGALRSRVKE